MDDSAAWGPVSPSWMAVRAQTVSLQCAGGECLERRGDGASDGYLVDPEPTADGTHELVVHRVHPRHTERLWQPGIGLDLCGCLLVVVGI